jgi:hypothetical protein
MFRDLDGVPRPPFYSSREELWVTWREERRKEEKKKEKNRETQEKKLQCLCQSSPMGGPCWSG